MRTRAKDLSMRLLKMLLWTALKKQGCNVLVSDLYEMKFKATATKEDITGVCEAVFCLFRKYETNKCLIRAQWQ